MSKLYSGFYVIFFNPGWFLVSLVMCPIPNSWIIRDRRQRSRKSTYNPLTLVGTVVIFLPSQCWCLRVGITGAKYLTLGGKEHNFLSEGGYCLGCDEDRRLKYFNLNIIWPVTDTCTQSSDFYMDQPPDTCIQTSDLYIDQTPETTMWIKTSS